MFLSNYEVLRFILQIMITTLAEKIKSPFIIPSNANVSQGILYGMLSD